jgi:hypothetical protein
VPGRASADSFGVPVIGFKPRMNTWRRCVRRRRRSGRAEKASRVAVVAVGGAGVAL